jgi:ubiquinone/menaquinone biosynthesis C-methylase UbiE
MRELWQTSVRVPISQPSISILDVGCGSGIWAREVAEVLPRSRVMGVDLSPVFLVEEPNRPIPENLSFEVLLLVVNMANNAKVDDINFGLQYPEASFDMVTSRFLAGGIANYFATIKEMYRILTGLGNSWIQITELRPGLYCDDNTIPADAASVKWPNIFFVSGKIGDTLGTSRFDEIATSLKTRVQAAGFVDVREYIDKAPVGNWHPGKFLDAM